MISTTELEECLCFNTMGCLLVNFSALCGSQLSSWWPILWWLLSAFEVHAIYTLLLTGLKGDRDTSFRLYFLSEPTFGCSASYFQVPPAGSFSLRFLCNTNTATRLPQCYLKCHLASLSLEITSHNSNIKLNQFCYWDGLSQCSFSCPKPSTSCTTNYGYWQ